MGTLQRSLAIIAEAFQTRRLTYGTWLFRREGELTEVVREFALWPKTRWGRVVLWGIGRVLKRAVARHLSDMTRIIVRRRAGA